MQELRKSFWLSPEFFLFVAFLTQNGITRGEGLRNIDKLSLEELDAKILDYTAVHKAPPAVIFGDYIHSSDVTIIAEQSPFVVEVQVIGTERTAHSVWPSQSLEAETVRQCFR